MKTLFRPHRGSLDDAMKEVIEIETLEDLLKIIINDLSGWGIKIDWEKSVNISQYGYDDRIKWNTHIVAIKGYGVYGFTNGMLKPSTSREA